MPGSSRYTKYITGECLPKRVKYFEPRGLAETTDWRQSETVASEPASHDGLAEV